jgi:hypothetical protein
MQELMKKIIPLFISALFFNTNTFGQKTPTDFGAMAFWCFQHNRIDSLFRDIPTSADLSGFANELGITEGTEAYSSFLKRYPLVIKSFKDKCYQIQRDSLEYNFSWAHAKLDKLEQEQKTIIPENTPSKKPVTLTSVNIYFYSGGQSYLLKFGDLHQYGAIWKPGNNLSLTIQYK